MGNEDFITLSELFHLSKKHKLTVLILIAIGTLFGLVGYYSKINYATKISITKKDSVFNIEKHEKINQEIEKLFLNFDNNLRYAKSMATHLKSKKASEQGDRHFLTLLDESENSLESVMAALLASKSMSQRSGQIFSYNFEMQDSGHYEFSYISKIALEPNSVLQLFLPIINTSIQEFNEEAHEHYSEQNSIKRTIFDDFYKSNSNGFFQDLEKISKRKLSNFEHYFKLQREIFQHSNQVSKLKLAKYGKELKAAKKLLVSGLSQELKNYPHLIQSVEFLHHKKFINDLQKDQYISRLEMILKKDQEFSQEHLKNKILYDNVVDKYTSYISGTQFPDQLSVKNIPSMNLCDKLCCENQCQFIYQNIEDKNIVKYLLGGAGFGVILFIFYIIALSMFRTSFREQN